MIVSRSPYRISFFGGGTDYEDWFSINGGAFLSMAINYYTYITFRIKPEFQEKQFMIRLQNREFVNMKLNKNFFYTLKFFFKSSLLIKNLRNYFLLITPKFILKKIMWYQ